MYPYTPQYYEFVLDMMVARVDFRFDFIGQIFYIKRSTNPRNSIGVKINQTGSPLVNLKRNEGIICAFETLFITNPAQVGTMTVFISADINRLRLIDTNEDYNTDYAELHPENLVCALAATEYTWVITQNSRGILIKARGGPIQFCFLPLESNVNYILLADGQSFFIDDIFFNATALYYQSANAGTVLEVMEKR